MTTEEKLDLLLEQIHRIENSVKTILDKQVIKDFYEVMEFARLVGKAPFTCREWCRLGRIRAEKKLSGRGAHACWVVPRVELLRYQREGLLPVQGPS
jgi:hypothetical protein